MIELKAELMKKRKEYEESKNRSKGTTSKVLKNTKTMTTQSAVNRNTKDISLASVDEEELKRSREALEAKARLYKKLERGRMLESDLNTNQRENLMVDFAFKGWNTGTEEFDFPVDDTSDDDNPSDRTMLGIDGVMKMIEEELESDDKWVEYEDEFGRLRVCKLGHLRQLQKDRQQVQSYQGDSKHYDGDAEIRNKGVAFYQFERDEEERTRQMSQLKKLREETVERRMRTLLVKEQRRLLLESRLSKLRKC